MIDDVFTKVWCFTLLFSLIITEKYLCVQNLSMSSQLGFCLS